MCTARTLTQVPTQRLGDCKGCLRARKRVFLAYADAYASCAPVVLLHTKCTWQLQKSTLTFQYKCSTRGAPGSCGLNEKRPPRKEQIHEWASSLRAACEDAYVDGGSSGTALYSMPTRTPANGCHHGGNLNPGVQLPPFEQRGVHTSPPLLSKG